MNEKSKNIGGQVMIGAFVSITLWYLSDYKNIKVPPEIASQMTILLTGLASWFIGGFNE